jgi:hypothetical protein
VNPISGMMASLPSIKDTIQYKRLQKTIDTWYYRESLKPTKDEFLAECDALFRQNITDSECEEDKAHRHRVLIWTMYCILFSHIFDMNSLDRKPNPMPCRECNGALGDVNHRRVYIKPKGSNEKYACQHFTKGKMLEEVPRMMTDFLLKQGRIMSSSFKELMGTDQGILNTKKPDINKQVTRWICLLPETFNLFVKNADVFANLRLSFQEREQYHMGPLFLALKNEEERGGEDDNAQSDSSSDDDDSSDSEVERRSLSI